MVKRAGVLVALDVAQRTRALSLATELAPWVDGFKVGLELLMGPGPAIVEEIAAIGAPVFCDAKLHDIPNTVEAAARRVGRLGARWLTVHAPGGRAMMEAAVAGFADGNGGKPGILAVTVLTSLDAEILTSVGVDRRPADQVGRLAALAGQAGVEGVVCSVHELDVVAQAAPRLVRVTPGVRPPGSPVGDQRRVATPAEAQAAGADWLVVGRPITTASNPVAAARRIVAELEESWKPD